MTKINKPNSIVNKKIISYAEQQKEIIVDWNKELKSLIKITKGLSGDEIYDFFVDDDKLYQNYNRLRNHAKLWVTCACGIQCSIIPRNENGSPEDKLLVILGTNFFNQFNNNDFNYCLTILEKIEKRSKELINHLTENSIVYYDK